MIRGNLALILEERARKLMNLRTKNHSRQIRFDESGSIKLENAFIGACVYVLLQINAKNLLINSITFT